MMSRPKIVNVRHRIPNIFCEDISDCVILPQRLIINSNKDKNFNSENARTQSMVGIGCSYNKHFGPSGVRALPLAAGINEGGNYFRYKYYSSFLVGFVLTTTIQNHRRGCRRVSNFCMGP